MNKKEAKELISKLVKKYEEAFDSVQIRKYSEEDTKKDFILPLFSILGWNTSDRNEVTSEESQSSGRVDYGFYLNQ